jgi:hypothetical protein
MRRLTTFLLTAALALPLASEALTLADLNAGASFSSTGGELAFEFDAGSIVLSGALPADLTQYAVLPTASGFLVSGPLGALGPAAFGALTLVYQVSAGAGLALTGADLQAAGLAFGAGAFAIAASGLSNGAGLGVLLLDGGGTGATDAVAFSSAAVLNAISSVQLFALTPGDVASFGSVQHGFAWVALPEPSAMWLLSAGLLGLGVFGSRHRGGPRAA